MGKTPFPDNAPPIGSGMNDPYGQSAPNYPPQQQQQHGHGHGHGHQHQHGHGQGNADQYRMGSGIGMAGEENYTPGTNISIGRAGEITPEPFQRPAPDAPRIGSGGEVLYHQGSDPSIGTAGEIAPPPYQRQFPNGPVIGSAGSNQQWDNSIGNANEGQQQNHGFFYNLFHRNQ